MEAIVVGRRPRRIGRTAGGAGVVGPLAIVAAPALAIVTPMCASRSSGSGWRASV